jgi:C-terminal processing protease CtpA/Prc
MIRQIRDGNNQTYPEWILNNYFSSYYSFLFGQPRLFSLELKNAAGELDKKQVTALTKDSIRFFSQFRYADGYPQKVEGQGITLEEKNNINTAILTIKSFDPDLLQSFYKQDYKLVMDSLFKHLSLQHTSNLILDLRNNQGGDFKPARYLLSYLIRNPSMFLLNGKEARLIQPQTNHFAGKIFVLINGGSFSATAIVIAILERDKRGIFIEEETGGNKHIISGDPIEVVLPGTKIRGYISTTNYRIVAGFNDGHGVLPTYPVHLKIADILTGNDTSKALAMELISKR